MQCSLGRRSPIIISPDPVLDRERHHDLHFELLNTIVHYRTWSLWPYLLGELAVTGFAEQVHSAILGRMSACGALLRVRPPNCLGGDDTVYGLRLGCVCSGREVFVVAKTMGEPCKAFYYRIAKTCTATL